jgi:FkbM family methyltransferase
VDIGASKGLYSFRAAPWSKSVLAFDPRFKKNHEFRRISHSIFDNIEIYDCGISDESGTVGFTEELGDLGRSHLSSLGINKSDFSRNMIIEVHTLDSFNLKKISMIKIDVEGAELKVLDGAIQTLARERPVVLVESERRHNPDCPEKMFTFFLDIGYKGFFFCDSSWLPLADFAVERHQRSEHTPVQEANYQKFEIYINNFLFLPLEKVDFFARLLK